jgi:phosphatidyl-myo-inositol dimannoside synthase
MPAAVMVTSSFLPGRGGIESYLAALCTELAPRLAVLAPATRDGRPVPDDLTYPVSGYPGSMIVPTRSVARSVIDECERQGADRVLFGTPWPLALVGHRLRRAGLRYAVVVHGAELLVPAAVPGVRARLAGALGEADLLLPVSRFTAAKLDALLAPSPPPIEVLRARVDTARFRPDARSSDVLDRLGVTGRKVVLTLGRLVRRKGVHRLIDALPAVAESVPDVVLVVAGTGPQRRALERRAGSAPVVFAGRVAADDTLSLYAAADVFALAVADRWFGLDVEGLGVVLLEASAAGTPCVTGRSGGTPEAVVDGQTGFVVDASNERDLTSALIALLGDPSTSDRMGRAAREFVTREFANRPLPAAFLEWLG